MCADVLSVWPERGLEPVVVCRSAERAVLVVRWGGGVVGEVVVPALAGAVSVDAQREAIVGALGERLSRELLSRSFLHAARGVEEGSSSSRGGVGSVSVVVCARLGGAGLDACLESVAELGEVEVVVVDCLGAGVGDVCAGRGVRWVSEPGVGVGRARNRGALETDGDVVGFLEDDCVVDAGWLDGVDEVFGDSLVMAAFGYVGPLELETRSQWLSAVAEGLGGQVPRGVLDRVAASRVAVGEGYPLVRRRAFERVGGFAEHLGPGTAVGGGLDLEFSRRLLAGGYRVGLDPGRVVWRRYPRELRDARRMWRDRAAGAMAAALEGVWRGDLGALRIAGSRGGARGPATKTVPFAVRLARAGGALSAPRRLARARRHVRAQPSLVAASSPTPAAPEPEAVVVSDGDLSLSVTIASYNRRERLLEVLRAMGGQSYPADRYDVVVVLDGSTDGSAGAVRALDVPYRLRVVEQENRGLAAGRNRGGAEAEAPVVVFLDDDIVPEPAFVAEHAQGHRDTGGRRIVLGSYPPAERDDEDLLSLQIRRSWADYFRRRSEPGHQWTYVDFADGNVSFPRELIGEAGGWDESFVPGRVRRQDWEYGIRLLQAGVRFVDRPAARGTHYFDTSFDTAVRNRRVEGRSDIVIGTKHPQVRSHLYAARILKTAAGRRAPDAYLSLAFDRPRAVERAIAAGMPVVRMLERGGLQGSWWALAGRLMSAAYVLGVMDALGSLGRFREFMAPALDAALPRLWVELEETGAVEMPSDAGTVELVVSRGGAEVARVNTPEPESQWDWKRLAERVADAAPPRAVAPDDLLDTVPGTAAPS